MNKKRLRKWRVNYVVTYQSQYFAKIYREPVLALLKNLALVKGIDCSTSCDHPFYDDEFLNEHKDLKDIVSDLVYFRSSLRTKIRSADFRKLVDAIFDEQKFLDFSDYPFEVFSQMQKNLHLFPYPDK